MDSVNKSSLVADLGERVRELRKKHKLSLVTLSARALVSVGMLSHIERNQTTPSLRTLNRICVALGIEMANLFPSEGPESSQSDCHVIRADQRSRLEFPSLGMSKVLLSASYWKTLEVFLIVITPNGGTGDEPLVRGGEKAGLVVGGSLRLTVGAHVHELREGDSFHFDSSVPHQLLNVSDEDARVLWIIRPNQLGNEM